MHSYQARASALLLICAMAQGHAADLGPDKQLIDACAARTDARMDSMTLRKLEQLRNFEFSLRMAMTQVTGGEQSMTASDWQTARANLLRTRKQLADACEVPIPSQG